MNIFKKLPLLFFKACVILGLVLDSQAIEQIPKLIGQFPSLKRFEKLTEDHRNFYCKLPKSVRNKVTLAASQEINTNGINRQLIESLVAGGEDVYIKRARTKQLSKEELEQFLLVFDAVVCKRTDKKHGKILVLLLFSDLDNIYANKVVVAKWLLTLVEKKKITPALQIKEFEEILQKARKRTKFPFLKRSGFAFLGSTHSFKLLWFLILATVLVALISVGGFFLFRHFGGRRSFRVF